MDINHKLDLIQELRREQNRRERNIYRNYDRNFRGENSIEEDNGNSIFASFRLRLLTAILLFLVFFMMDKKDFSFGEIDNQQIVECISEHITIEDSFVIVDEKQ